MSRNDPSESVRYQVATAAPRRLDDFLRESLPAVSRRALRATLAAGGVRVNGRRARKGDTVHNGDVVIVPASLTAAGELTPQPDLPVPLLHVDADLIAVCKPAGMPSVAQRASDRGTLANFLAARFPETAALGDHPFECGAAHRLDTDTSGVLLAARTAAAYRNLRRAFQRAAVGREYQAVVRGAVTAPRTISLPLRPLGRRGARVAVAGAGQANARPASTDIAPLRSLGGATLLRVVIHTGVRHQIRVHLAAIGHPVLGDRVYGETAADSTPRLLLHAERLRIAHPRSGERFSVEAPPPPDFVAALEAAGLSGA